MKCRFWYLHGSNNCRVFSKIFALKHINYSPSIFLRLWNNEWKSSYAQWQSHILQFDLIIFFSYRQWLEFHAPSFSKKFLLLCTLFIYHNHCNNAKTILLREIFQISWGFDLFMTLDNIYLNINLIAITLFFFSYASIFQTNENIIKNITSL